MGVNIANKLANTKFYNYYFFIFASKQFHKPKPVQFFQNNEQSPEMYNKAFKEV